MQGIGHCDLLTERECKDTTIPRSTVGLRGIACLFLSIKAITWDYRLEVGCCLERLKAGDKKIAPKGDFFVLYYYSVAIFRALPDLQRSDLQPVGRSNITS